MPVRIGDQFVGDQRQVRQRFNADPGGFGPHRQQHGPAEQRVGIVQEAAEAVEIDVGAHALELFRLVERLVGHGHGAHLHREIAKGGPRHLVVRFHFAKVRQAGHHLQVVLHAVVDFAQQHFLGGEIFLQAVAVADVGGNVPRDAEGDRPADAPHRQERPRVRFAIGVYRHVHDRGAVRAHEADAQVASHPFARAAFVEQLGLRADDSPGFADPVHDMPARDEFALVGMDDAQEMGADEVFGRVAEIADAFAEVDETPVHVQEVDDVGQGIQQGPEPSGVGKVELRGPVGLAGDSGDGSGHPWSHTRAPRPRGQARSGRGAARQGPGARALTPPRPPPVYSTS